MEDSRITNKDKILMMGFILAPMNGLRFFKIGPAEILILIWCFLNYKQCLKINVKNYNFIFWSIFLFVISVGANYGILFYPNQVDYTGLTTWFYFMVISISIYQVFRNKSYNYSNNFLKKTISISIIWYFFLYLYSFFINDVFLGAPLWYENVRFSGGANNPHQLAVLLAAITPLILKYLEESNNRLTKLYNISLFCIAIFLGMETNTATLQLSLVVSLAFLFYSIKLNKIKNIKNKFILYILTVIITIIIFLFFYQYFYESFVAWLTSDPNGLGRIKIFTTITDTLNKNWIFGLGPGTHAYFGELEYHNTYLEIIAMSGVLGFAIFIIYTIKIFKNLKIDIYFMSAIISLYVYGLAGFSLRRLAYWSVLMLLLAIAEKKNVNEAKKVPANIF